VRKQIDSRGQMDEDIPFEIGESHSMSNIQIILSAIGLGICLQGSVGGAGKTASQLSEELKSARALRVRCMDRGESRGVTITEPAKLKRILDTIQVKEVREGMHASVDPVCEVTFVLSDGKLMETRFVTSSQLDQSFWGQIYLGNDKFHAVISTLIAEELGRKPGVLTP
jgi:hypothetical protein